MTIDSILNCHLKDMEYHCNKIMGMTIEEAEEYCKTHSFTSRRTTDDGGISLFVTDDYCLSRINLENDSKGIIIRSFIG